MRKTVRVAFSLLLVVTLLSVATTGCRRSKPSGTGASPAGGGESVASMASTPGGVPPTPLTPTLTHPTATPTLSPTAVIPTPTASPVVPTPTASPIAPTLAVETSVPEATPISVVEPSPEESATAAEELTYTVKWGDSLWALAGRFETTVADIASLNGLTNTDFIPVGQVLRIQTVAPAQPGTYFTHVVQRGDCLSVIAERYGTTVEELRRINRIVNPWYIYVGQALQVPSGASQEATSGTRYTVRPGDTLWHVAIRYGTTVWRIRIANNLRNPNLIYPGQVLTIP